MTKIEQLEARIEALEWMMDGNYSMRQIGNEWFVIHDIIGIAGYGFTRPGAIADARSKHP